MNVYAEKLRPVALKAKNVMSAPFRMLSVALFTAMTGLMATSPTLCDKIKSNIDMDTLFGNMAEIIIKIAFYVGAIVAISGIFQLVLAYKDDNGATRSAVKSCGIA